VSRLQQILWDIEERSALGLNELGVWEDALRVAAAEDAGSDDLKDLVQRAVRNAGRLGPGRAPRWVFVKGAFALGATRAIALCREHGLDPYEQIGAVP